MKEQLRQSEDAVTISAIGKMEKMAKYVIGIAKMYAGMAYVQVLRNVVIVPATAVAANAATEHAIWPREIPALRALRTAELVAATEHANLTSEKIVIHAPGTAEPALSGVETEYAQALKPAPAALAIADYVLLSAVTERVLLFEKLVLPVFLIVGDVLLRFAVTDSVFFQKPVQYAHQIVVLLIVAMAHVTAAKHATRALMIAEHAGHVSWPERL